MSTPAAAAEYIRRGRAPIPVPLGKKVPALEAWQDLRLTLDDVPRYFGDGRVNIGLLMGAASDNLADVDFDCPEALALAHRLPRTGLVMGRPGKPLSHLFYRAPGCATRRYKDIDGTTIVEVRGGGTQTLVPPSRHPSGEHYAWEEDGEPATIPAADLQRAGACLATAALLARHAPGKGSRHDAALALAGGLLRHGWGEDETATFVRDVAMAAGDEEWQARGRDVATTARRLANDGPAVGWPRLAQLLSDGDAVVRLARDWLGLRGTGTAAPGGDAPPEAATWLSPLPIGPPALPSFPTEALPSALRDFVLALARSTQTPTDLTALMALAAAAIAVQRKLVVKLNDDWREPLNIYGAIVLPSGERKSAVLRAVRAPVEAYERKQAQEDAPRLAEQRAERKILEGRLSKAQRTAAEAAKPDDRQAAAEEAKKLARELAPTPEVFDLQLLADDATPEALATVLYEQGGRVGTLAAEGTPFEVMAGRYAKDGKPNLGVYLKAHAGDEIRVNRRGRKETIPDPALSLGLLVQPAVVRAIGDRRELRGLGLAARFLYALPASLIGYRDQSPPTVPADVRVAYAQTITALLDRPLPGDAAPDLILDANAAAAFLAFRQEAEGALRPFALLGDLTDWGGKLPGLVARLAGLLHLVKHADHKRPQDEPITPATMAAAIAIGEYLIPHALAAFDLMGADEGLADARYLAAWVERQVAALDGKPLAHQTIWQATKRRFGEVGPLDRALAVLVEHRYLRPRPDSEGATGRPRRPDYDVNPDLAERTPNTPNTPGAAGSRGIRGTNGRPEDADDDDAAVGEV